MGGVYCFTLVCSSPEISVAFFMFFSVCYKTVWHGLRLIAHLLPVYQIFIYYSNTYRDCITFCSQLYRELWKIRASWNLLSGCMWTCFTVNVFLESFLFNFLKQVAIITVLLGLIRGPFEWQFLCYILWYITWNSQR